MISTVIGCSSAFRLSATFEINAPSVKEITQAMGRISFFIFVDEFELQFSKNLGLKKMSFNILLLQLFCKYIRC